jgi:hypothetical protein
MMTKFLQDSILPKWSIVVSRAKCTTTASNKFISTKLLKLLSHNCCLSAKAEYLSNPPEAQIIASFDQTSLENE